MTGSRPQRKQQLALVLVLMLIAAALAVRVWHDRSAQSKPALSVNETERQAREHPNDLQAQLDWGSVLAKAGRLQDAVAVFAHAAQLAPRDARPYTWLGILAVQDHRPDIARANFEQSVHLNPSDPDVWHTLGELYSQAHVRRRAIDAYEHATRLNPNDEIAWRQLGVLQTEDKLQARGHDALVRATTLKPEDTAAQIDLGDSALAMGRLPEAKQAFETVLAHRPDDPTALVGSAEASMQLDPSPGSLSHAEQQVNHALALHSTAHAHLVLGRIALLRRDFHRAADEMKASLTLDPHTSETYGYLSQAYVGMGRLDLARKAGADLQKVYAHTKR